MKNNSVTTKHWLGIAAGSVIAMSAVTVQAATLTEVESNDTFATANAGGAGSNTLVGSIGGIVDLGAAGNAAVNLNDVDIWAFELQAGQAFTSSITYNGLYNPFDVQPVTTLYWENAGSYYPVATTDPQAFASSFSFTPWASGSYFLAVTSDFNQGRDAFGNFQSDASFLTQVFNDHLIIGTPFSHFHGMSFTTFDYEIQTVGAVPVPAAVWLFGSGLLGLIGVARRRAK